MWTYQLLLLMLCISMGRSQNKRNSKPDRQGNNSTATSRGIPVFIGNWQSAPNAQNNQGVKWNSQMKGPSLAWFDGSNPGSAPIKRTGQSRNGTNSNQKANFAKSERGNNMQTGNGQSNIRNGAPWNNNQNQNAYPGYWYMNGPNQYNGPPPYWNNGPGPNGPPSNWNTPGQNGPPSNWNNRPGQNGPPNNWGTQGQSGSPPNQNNGPGPNGPPSNWNTQGQNGPPNNWNTQGQSGPPPNWQTGQHGPPYNWNSFGPGNNGPGPNTNWNGPGPNMNWNGPSGPNVNWNGPPGGFGPNPAFMSHHMGQSPSGMGIALLDPDLPDGLDDRFQQMQATHAMKQMGVNIGPPPPIIMPPVPLPAIASQSQSPPWIPGQGQQQSQFSGSNQNATVKRVGWPLRPSSRAGFWTRPSQNNTKENSNNQNSTTSTTVNTSVVPTPTLAEFQHKSKRNITSNTQRPSYNYNYPYGNWNSGVYSPIGFRNWPPFQRPDVPDHLEDRSPNKTHSSIDVKLQGTSFGERRFSSAPPKIPNLTSNMRGFERQKIGQTLPRQRIRGLAKSPSIRIWPSRAPSPRRQDFYDQRIRNIERVLSKTSSGNRTQGQFDPRRTLSMSSSTNRERKVEREPEPEKKYDGDHETERDTEKEEGAKNIDPRVVRRVLDVIKQQSRGDAVSLDSIMAGLNDQGYKFKMKYKYEGSVPAPAWVDRLGNIDAGPTSLPTPTKEASQSRVNITAPRVSEVMMSPTQVVRQQVRPFQPRNLSNFHFGNQNSNIHSFPTFQLQGSPSDSSVRNRDSQWRSPSSQTGVVAPRPIIGLLSHNVQGNKTDKETTDIPHLADILKSVVQDASKTTTRSSSTVSPSDFEVKVERGPDGPILNIEHDPVPRASSGTPIARKPNKFNLSNMNAITAKPATQPNMPSMTMKSFHTQKGVKNVSVDFISNKTEKLQQMEPIPVPEISASQTFGIIVGVIIGFTVILAPIICLICRFRDKRKQKQRKLSAKNESTNNKDDGGLMEAMIASELGAVKASTKGVTRPKHKWIGPKSNNLEEDGEYSELQELKSNKHTTNVEIHC